MIISVFHENYVVNNRQDETVNKINIIFFQALLLNRTTIYKNITTSERQPL